MNDQPPVVHRRAPRRKAMLFAGAATMLVLALVAYVAYGDRFGKSGADAGSDRTVAQRGGSAAPSGAAPSSPAASPPVPAAQATVSRAPLTNPGGSTGGTCGLPKYPKPSCTGVPAGTKLTELPLNVDNDSYAVRTPGAVIDARHIRGNLLVWADNVTIRNSQIDGTVYNDQGTTKHPYTITDSTIGVASNCVTQPGLTYANYTARRVKVLGHDDGFRVDTPGHVAIYDSYAKLCWNPPAKAPPDGSHSGGIQAECGDGVCRDAVFIHNTVDNRGPHGNSGMTYMAFDNNPTSGWTANDNLVMGGSYTVIFWWTGGPNYEVHNNRVVKNEWAYGPADTRGSCAHQNWSGNTLVTIDDTYDIASTVGPLACVN
jgi:hypothetical protein